MPVHTRSLRRHFLNFGSTTQFLEKWTNLEILPCSGFFDDRIINIFKTFLNPRYGPSTNDKWVIWGHDIYGVDSGRTKEYCEKMNNDLGVTCILPDFFRGAEGRPDPVPVWEGQLSRITNNLLKLINLSALGLDWDELLVPYLEIGGAQSVGVVGTCFGSYIAIHTSASGASFMRGGVSIHPAHPGMGSMMRYQL